MTTETESARRLAARLRALEGLHPRVIDLSLGRVERLLDRLGRPQDRLPPVIHLAGTNGKGSVLALLDACLTAAGQRVHAYTSPHLVRFNERIRLAGQDIGDDALLALINRVESVNDGAEITFFEVTTALAYLAFAEAPADWLLLETGLGGRLDATNVIATPALSIITPVSLDHQSYLGDTLEAIAGEKAGILKPGVPAVIADQPPEALAVIERAAGEAGAGLYLAGRDWQVEPAEGGLSFRGRDWRLDLPAPALAGAHQIGNAGTAIAALQLLTVSGQLPRNAMPGAISAGLRQVRWPARLQQLTDGPLATGLSPGWELWLDGGHNPSAAAALADWIAGSDRPVWLVVALLGNRDPGAFLRPLAGMAAGLFAIPGPGDHDWHTAEDIAGAAAALGLTADTAESVEDAIRQIAATGDQGRILIAGSLYLAGEVLARA